MLQRPYQNDQDIRKKQIDTLKIFNENVTEVVENSEYNVEFTVNGKNFTLNVHLPQDFPFERPVIFLLPALVHEWIDNANQIIGAPGLINYSIHSELGRIVQAIIRELQRSTPQPQSDLFPELNDLSVEELQEILENTDLQDKYLNTCPELLNMDLQSEQLINSIEKIAQENLSQQQELDSLKTEIIDKITNIEQMKINFEQLNRKYQKISEMYDPHNIKNCLHDSALKADEEAEKIAEQFLLGNMPVEVFINKFAEKRALGQARRAKEERLTHQLAQLDRATS